jgi:type I restriction enzyme S subunit
MMSKENIKFKLPEGWIWSTIGELGIITSGGTPSTKEPQYWSGDIPWITPADLSNFKGKLISQGQRNISKLGLDYSSAILLPKGSLIFSSRAPIGYLAISKNELATNQGFKNIIPVESIHIDYIFYYLQAAKQMIQNMASGTTFLELSLSNFKRIPIPVPPLNEQHQIVEKLEELFSELEQSKIGLIKAQTQLRIYRHAFLKNVLKNNGIINTDPIDKKRRKFKKVMLGDVVSKISKKVHPLDNPTLKFIGLDSIEPGSLKPQLIHSFKDFSSSGNYFEKDNILYARMRPYLNKVYKAEFNGASSGEFIVLKCNTEILVDYLKYILHSADFVNYANEKSTGDRPRVSFEDISLFEFYISNIEDQQQIVNEIDYRFTIIENLEETIESNLKGIELYRQSIFKKAFNGSLIPQDPENEPADKLLIRIREEIQNYSKEQKEDSLKSPKMKQSKKTLIEIIKENYPNSEFSFTELREHLNISYNDIKEQLFFLLENDKEIISSFSKTKKEIIYKLKS